MTNVDIVIRTVDQAKAGFTSIINNLRGVGDSADIAAKKAAIFGAVWGTTTALIVDSYNAYSKLAESVRDLSLVSGESAESTSRFIQVLDDYQLTAEDATSAAKKLKENGLSPTIETLAALSDQFRGIQDPAERMDFVYDKLGKSGAKYVNMLNQGSEALLANAAAINQNLILSDFEIKMYEVGRLAIDEKRDALEGFRVELGKNVGNVLAFAKAMERAYEIQSESTKQFRGSTVTTKDFSEALNEAIAEQLKAADAAEEYKYNLEEQAKAAKENSDINKEFLSTLSSIASSEESYQSKSKSLTEERTKIEKERADAISQGWWEGSEKIKEYDEALAENDAKVQENAAAHDQANKEIMLGLLERKLMQDGMLDDKELQFLLDKGVAWGVYSQTVVDETQKALEEVNLLVEGIGSIPTSKEFTLMINQVGATDANYGGSGASQVAGRRAGGGSVAAGQTYLVGEKGMELFTPNQSGTITPNNQLGSGVDTEKIVSAIYSTKIDINDLARVVVIMAQQVSK